MFFVCGYNPVMTRGGAWATPAYPALEAALSFNAMVLHNRKMAENFYRPLGLIMLDKDDRQTPEQIQEMQKLIDERWQQKTKELGGGNTPIAVRGFDFQEIGQSSKEANFIETLDSLTRIIAMSYHFPPQFLGNAETSQFAQLLRSPAATYYDACVLPKAQVVCCAECKNQFSTTCPLALANSAFALTSTKSLRSRSTEWSRPEC